MTDTESQRGLQAEVEALRARVRDLECQVQQARELEIGRVECLYRDLLDHARDCLWRLDANWEFQFVSRAVEHLTGYRPEELIGASFEVVLSAESVEQARAVMQERLAGELPKEGITLVLSHRRKDGSEFIGELRSVPIYGASGELVALEGSTRDVTQRQAFQEALRRSERRYRHLYERSPAVNVTMTAEGQIVDCNDTLCGLLDRDREETIGRSVLDLVVPAHRPRMVGVLSRLAAGQWVGDVEVDVFGPGGEVYSMILAPGCVDTAGPGDERLLVVTAVDNTDQKRAEQLLRESNIELERRVAERTAELAEANRQLQKEVVDRQAAERHVRDSAANFRALAENASDAMLMGDAAGRHVFANRRASELLGYSMPELLGTTVRDIVHAEDMETVLSKYERRLKGELRPSPYEVRLVRKDGTAVLVEVMGSKTSWRGQVANLAIIRDISDRKRAEAASRILRDSMEQSRDGMLISDEVGRVTYANRAIGELLGADPGELIGRAHDEVLVLDAGTRDQLDSVLERHRSWSGRIEIMRQQEGPRTVELTRLRILDELGRRIATVDTCRDLRASDRLEALQQTMEAVAAGITSYEGLLQRIMARLPQLVGSAGWAIYARDSEGKGFVGVTGDEVGRTFMASFPIIPLEGSPAVRSAMEGDILLSADLLSDPMFEINPGLEAFLPLLARLNIRAVCGLPIRRGAEVLGLLIVSDRRVRDFTTEETGILRALAAQIALVMERGGGASGEVPPATVMSGGKGSDLVAVSQAMQGVVRAADRIAASDLPAIILGPTGSGKGHLARYIHSVSSRAESPFLVVNCACLDGDLILSELFGHERGSFTGAMRRQKGCFELANGGTLLLDEAIELPPDAQAKLLQVVETQQFRRLGGQETIVTDVRLLCVTNADIRECVRSGKFRQDLYYRLNAAEIVVPPLRDRPEDIVPLAEEYLRTQAVTRGTAASTLTEDAMRRLCEYDWPGNVRELQNVLLQAWSFGRDEIRAADLHFSPVRGPEAERPSAVDGEEAERDRIVQVLQRHQWNRSKAAEELGIHRNTLRDRMRKLGVIG